MLPVIDRDRTIRQRLRQPQREKSGSNGAMSCWRFQQKLRLRNDIYNLADVLSLPDRIVCYNGVNVDMVDALCIFLKRFAYPCRYVDMIPRFGSPEPQMCMISNAVMNELYQTWNRLLTDLN